MMADMVSTTETTRVLIIEDDTDVRAMLRRMLQQAGYDTVEARDGRLGLEACAACRVDVVLTDIVMPEMEGIETIREIRARYPDVAIVAMSGGDTDYDDSYLSMARMLGAKHTLTKPFRRNELLTIIEEIRHSAA